MDKSQDFVQTPPVLTNQPLAPRNTTLPDDFDDSDFETHDDDMRVLTPTSPALGADGLDDLPPTYEEAQAQASRDLGQLEPGTRAASASVNDLQVHRLVLVPNESQASLRSTSPNPPAQSSAPAPAAQTPQAAWHAQLEEVGRAQLSYDTARSEETGALDAMLDELLSFTHNAINSDVDYASYLDRRIAIPPTHDATHAQFARAYSKILHAHSISQTELTAFIDGLNTLLASAPSVGEAHQAVLAAVDSSGSEVPPAAQVLQRYLYRANAHFFAPRGVVANLQTLRTLLHRISQEQHKGRRADTASLRRAVLDAGNERDVAQALEPYVEPLSWAIHPPTGTNLQSPVEQMSQQRNTSAGPGNPPRSDASNGKTWQGVGASDVPTNRDAMLSDATLPSYQSVEQSHREYITQPPLQPSSARPAPPQATSAYAEADIPKPPGAFPDPGSPPPGGLAGSIASWGEDFGRRMGKWGEDQGRSWGAWGENQGRVWGRWGEEQGRRWGDFGEHLGRRIEHTFTGSSPGPADNHHNRHQNRADWQPARRGPGGRRGRALLGAHADPFGRHCGPLGHRGGLLGPNGPLGSHGLLGHGGPLGPNNLVAQHLHALQQHRSQLGRRRLQGGPWHSDSGPAGNDDNPHGGRRGRRHGRCGHRSGRRSHSQDSSSSDSSDSDSDLDSDAEAEADYLEAQQTFARRRDSIEKKFQQDTMSLGEKARESDITKLNQKREKDLGKAVQDKAKADVKFKGRRYKRQERAVFKTLRRELKQDKRRVKRDAKRGAVSKDEARAAKAQYKETVRVAAAEYKQRVRQHNEQLAKATAGGHSDNTGPATEGSWMVWLVIEDLERAALQEV